MTASRVLAPLALVLLLPLGAAAQSSGYDLAALRGLCDDVYKNFEAETGAPFRYQYEERIVRAARVPADEARDALRRADSPGAQRIQAMWNYAVEHREELPWGTLFCDTSNFDLSFGYVLKYAIAMQNFRFLAQAVQVWGVPVNLVHRYADAGLRYGTVLDYLQSEIDRTEGTETAQSLRTYYRIVREAGGLHGHELR